MVQSGWNLLRTKEYKNQDRSKANTDTNLISITIILISHNYGCYLTEAIDRVLNQTHSPDEILIINDSSTGATHIIADQYSNQGVKYLRVENQCAHLSRYDGLLATQSEFVLFLDADNTLPSDYIEVGLREFTDPAVGVVYADLHKFGARKVTTNFPECTVGKLFRENFVDACSLREERQTSPTNTNYAS